MPSVLELEKNISFRIVNAHQSMSYSRPKMTPGLTYIAGIHIRPVKPLPTDVQVIFASFEIFTFTRMYFVFVFVSGIS